MKVGIITFYYKSLNYGGNLQAYALCKFLNARGIDAEQIPYHKIVDNSLKTRIRRNLEGGLVSVIKKIFLRLYYKRESFSVDENEMYIRINAFKKFQQEIIPHAENVYTQDTIVQCVDKYDLFITGSDQVWNFKWYDSAYFLDFVKDKSKRKVSYAASFSMKEFSDSQIGVIKESLNDYEAISVREYDAVQFLEGVVNLPVTHVLDPTLLLEKDDWDKVCAERLIEEKYVFGYYLGSNIETVKIAKRFAHNRNHKFVMIPFAVDSYCMNEDGLADIRVVDASPEKFLSLIKHAEFIFTDSFHAVVFSFIYQKQFFVFNRDSKGDMNSRITSITELLELKERFCSTKEQETLQYVELLYEIDYSRDFTRYKEYKIQSINFIEENILNIAKDE